MEKGTDEEKASLRTEYLNALQTNTQAKAHLVLLSQRRADSAAPELNQQRLSERDHLTRHLDALRLLRHYGDLQTLSHYVAEVGQTANRENLYTQPSVSNDPQSDAAQHGDGTFTYTDVAEAQKRVDTLNATAKALTDNLKLALVRARQQLKLEQSLLEYAKAQCEGQLVDGPAELGSKFPALETTRDELQGWISDCLAKCEEESVQPHQQVPSQGQVYSLDTEDGGPKVSIDREYEVYIEARKRILAVTHALRSPLQPFSNTASAVLSDTHAVRTIGELQRPLHLRHESQVHITQPHEDSFRPSLSTIQGTCLPEHQHEKHLAMLSTHLKQQTQVQDAQLLQILNLLSHESHLLPAHPIPSSKQQAGTTNTQHSAQQAEIDLLLRAWSYASRTADKIFSDSTQSQTDIARLALQHAGQNLEEMRTLDVTKKALLGYS